MTTTLADIAEKTGLSQATISRTLNNKPGVSSKTKAMIFKTMEELGMNPSASRATEMKQVALITPDMSNPIFANFATNLSVLLSQQHTLPLLCAYTLYGGNESSYMEEILNYHISGAIFLSGQYDTKGADLSHYYTLAKQRIPMVFLNASAHEVDGFYVETDDMTAVNMALTHLINLGHSKIGLLFGDKDHYPSIRKYDAAERFFHEKKIDHDPRLTVWTTYGIGSGQMATTALIKAGATAIMCASDQLALGAIKAATALNLSVPEDISITGYDDSLAMNYISPSLTTVRQPVDLMSRALVNGFNTLQADPRTATKRNIAIYEPELVVRGSTGICRVRR